MNVRQGQCERRHRHKAYLLLMEDLLTSFGGAVTAVGVLWDDPHNWIFERSFFFMRLRLAADLAAKCHSAGLS